MDAADLAGDEQYEREQEAADERRFHEDRGSWNGWESEEEYERFDEQVWGPRP